MTEMEICNVLVKYGQVFCFRRFTCVPNVSHGWGLDYEADLIAVTPSGYASEVEIKTSLNDLEADAKKSKWVNGLDPRIKKFYFAVPDKLVRSALDKDPRYGVIRIYLAHDGEWRTEIARKAKDLPCRRVTGDEILRLHRLATVRYWDLRLRTGVSQ